MITLSFLTGLNLLYLKEWRKYIATFYVVFLIVFLGFRNEIGGDWYSYLDQYFETSENNPHPLSKLSNLIKTFNGGYTTLNVSVSIVGVLALYFRLGHKHFLFGMGTYGVLVIPFFFASLMKSILAFSICQLGLVGKMLAFLIHPATAAVALFEGRKLLFVTSIFVIILILNYGFPFYSQYLSGYNSRGFMMRWMFVTIALLFQSKLRSHILPLIVLLIISIFYQTIADRVFMLYVLFFILSKDEVSTKLDFGVLCCIVWSVCFAIFYTWYVGNTAYVPWRLLVFNEEILIF